MQTQEKALNSISAGDTTNTPLAIGANVGNGFTKVATTTNFWAVRSLVSEVPENDFFEGNPETLRVEYQGKTYKVGPQPEASARRVADAGKKELYPLLALSAITQLLPYDGTHTLSVRIAVLNKAMAKAIDLTGEHLLVVNGRTYNLNIVSCKASPEGNGAVATYSRFAADSKIFSLDLGHGTTICLKTVAGRMESHKVTQWGVIDLHQALAQEVAKVNALEQVPHTVDIDDAIKDGSYTLHTPEGEIDFTDLYMPQLEQWWNQIKVKALSANANQRKGCKLLLIGGGSKLPGLSNLTKAAILENPGEAEAKGLARAAIL